MKLDHFVVNIDEKYQKDEKNISKISDSIPYEPKWGKGTKGFKASNLWIGNEYLEMIHILKKNGGGWVPEWTAKFNQGHRGMICLMLDVPDIDFIVQNLKSKGIPVTEPKWLEFKWFFNILTRRMPWRNSYIPFFENVPFQIGFQEMKDDRSRELMNQYMVPNYYMSLFSSSVNDNNSSAYLICNCIISNIFLKVITVISGKLPLKALFFSANPSFSLLSSPFNSSN